MKTRDKFIHGGERVQRSQAGALPLPPSGAWGKRWATMTNGATYPPAFGGVGETIEFSRRREQLSSRHRGRGGNFLVLPVFALLELPPSATSWEILVMQKLAILVKKTTVRK